MRIVDTDSEKRACQVCGKREYLSSIDDEGREVCKECYHVAYERMRAEGAFD